MSLVRAAALIIALALGAASVQAEDAPKFATKEGDVVVHDFHFRSGESMRELRLHYTTLGEPKRDASGLITNAVLILHGTGGTGQQFLRPQFAGVLFVPGGLLDPAKYFIILPDGIGHGKSSKPSDGLHARFPRYDYDDMVAAHHALLTQGLGVEHARLIMGTSMGCMHAFVWGEMYPHFMDALMPLACQPVQIAGRNRMWRKLLMDAIRLDPDWKGGEYTSQPREALRTAASLLLIAGSVPLLMQKDQGTRDAADKYVTETIDRNLSQLDANDLLYQVDASRNYDPSAQLSKIQVPVMPINYADDFINTPQLGIAAHGAKRLMNGRFVLIPITEQTHGHGTHTWAAVWSQYLKQLLEDTDHR